MYVLHNALRRLHIFTAGNSGRPNTSPHIVGSGCRPSTSSSQNTIVPSSNLTLQSPFIGNFRNFVGLLASAAKNPLWTKLSYLNGNNWTKTSKRPWYLSSTICTVPMRTISLAGGGYARYWASILYLTHWMSARRWNVPSLCDVLHFIKRSSIRPWKANMSISSILLKQKDGVKKLLFTRPCLSFGRTRNRRDRSSLWGMLRREISFVGYSNIFWTIPIKMGWPSQYLVKGQCARLSQDLALIVWHRT